MRHVEPTHGDPRLFQGACGVFDRFRRTRQHDFASGRSPRRDRGGTRHTSPAVARTASMPPPAGSCCMRRPRATTSRQASSRLNTSAMAAAAYSPMLCPSSQAGSAPSRSSACACAYCSAKIAGWANSVRLMRFVVHDLADSRTEVRRHRRVDLVERVAEHRAALVQCRRHAGELRALAAEQPARRHSRGGARLEVAAQCCDGLGAVSRRRSPAVPCLRP